MERPVIFLYTSYRTGGTALLSAFNADSTYLTFYDPLNGHLSRLESARDANSVNWNSNHPADIKYFENYLPLFEQGTMNLFPNLSEFRFRNSSVEFKDHLVQYLGALTDVALAQGKLPVFKLEQLEGHVNLLRENFPEALHVGLIRNPNDQFQSWLEQLVLGNSWFFDNAFSLINRDADFFKPMPGLSEANPKDIFETFHSRLVTLRSELDFTYNLFEDSFGDLLGKITSNFYKDKFTSVVKVFNKVDQQVSFEKKFNRMIDNSLKLTKERDELTKERDELTKERDELLNSTIYKFTKPLRALVNFVKK